MMEEVIEAINGCLEKDRLILHRSLKEHPSVRACKTFVYDVYVKREGEPVLLLSRSYRAAVTRAEAVEKWGIYDKEFMKELVRWISRNELGIQ